MKHVFPKIDSLSNLKNPLLFRLSSILWYVEGWRKFVLVSVVLSSFFWVLLGFDSTVGQIIPVSLDLSAPSLITSFPTFLSGYISLSELVEHTKACYGLGTHWSAVVIYGLFFILLSKHYERIGIKKSMNLILSLFFTLLAISIFELAWMFSYAHFQNQPWVLGTKHAPFRMNTFFIMVGVLAVVFTLASPYNFNFNKKSLSLILLSLGLWGLWIFYPLPVRSLSVLITTGEIWSNTPNFPQTQYTIDVYPLDNLRAGFAFHVEDNIVHFINTFTKAILALTVFNFCVLKKK